MSEDARDPEYDLLHHDILAALDEHEAENPRVVVSVLADRLGTGVCPKAVALKLTADALLARIRAGLVPDPRAAVERAAWEAAETAAKLFETMKAKADAPAPEAE